MEELFSVVEVAKLQILLDERNKLIRESSSSYDRQRALPLDTDEKQLQALTTQKLWEELERVSQELKRLGVIDRYGLTDKAVKSGIKHRY